MIKKLLRIPISFIISLLLAIIIFQPLEGWDSLTGIAFLVLFYGYVLLIPIAAVSFAIIASKEHLNNFFKNKYLVIIIAILSLIVPIIAWQIKFKSGLFFFSCWLLVLLVWIISFFNLNRLIKPNH